MFETVTAEREMEMIQMGKDAMQRNFFEKDQSFQDCLKRTLDGYNEAARKAAISAKYAAKTGEVKDIREAQWWETVTGTIEECLRVAINEDVEFSMPVAPRFDLANTEMKDAVK